MLKYFYPLLRFFNPSFLPEDRNWLRVTSLILMALYITHIMVFASIISRPERKELLIQDNDNNQVLKVLFNTVPITGTVRKQKQHFSTTK